MRARAAAAAAATVIVELHDFLDPGVGDAIVARFEDTHDVVLVRERRRNRRRTSCLLSEYRPGPMRWAVMTPR